MKLCELFDTLDELKIDNRHGAGAVPDNLNVDYLGLNVQMKPSMFLKLAAHLSNPQSAAELADYIKQGGAIGAPFLSIELPEEWFDNTPDYNKPARISGHEGRNRMIAVQKVEGDNPVEVHLFFRGGLRRRHLTPEIIERLQYNTKGIYNQDKKFILDTPLFSFENKQQLNELFAKPYEFTEVKRDQYKFTTRTGNEYLVLCDKNSFFDSDLMTWLPCIEVQFGMMSDNQFQSSVQKSGDAFNVFATVAQIVKHHLVKLSESEYTNYLSFTASHSEPSRVKLYNTFIKYVPKFLPDYKSYKVIDEYGERAYSFKKINAKEV